MTDISKNKVIADATPDISVIIPVYNSGRSIVKTLDSVCGQSLQSIEVICINDASIDDTLNYITEYARRDARISVETMHARSGQSHARRKGMMSAKGRYIAFVDAGDTLLPDSLVTLLERAEATNSDITIMGSLVDFGIIFPKKIFYSPEKKLADISCGNIVATRQAFLSLCRKDGILGSMCDKLYSRRLIEEYMPESVDWNVGEDYYFNVSIFPYANKIAWTDYYGYVWEYSGMGIKYYLKNWNKACLPYYELIGKKFNLTQTLNMSRRDYLKSLESAFLKDLTDNCTLRIIRLQPKRKILRFIQEETERFFAALNRVSKESSPDNKEAENSHTPPDATSLYADARQHLHNHKKFYIFTHIINLFR